MIWIIATSSAHMMITGAKPLNWSMNSVILDPLPHISAPDLTNAVMMQCSENRTALRAFRATPDWLKIFRGDDVAFMFRHEKAGTAFMPSR
jgi:cupin superfamily acireductone dioxygenase involved in methionine salvage